MTASNSAEKSSYFTRRVFPALAAGGLLLSLSGCGEVAADLLHDKDTTAPPFRCEDWLHDTQRLTLKPSAQNPIRIRDTFHADHGSIITTVRTPASFEVGKESHEVPVCREVNSYTWLGIQAGAVPDNLRGAFGAGANDSLPRNPQEFVWFAVTSAVTLTSAK